MSDLVVRIGLRPAVRLSQALWRRLGGNHPDRRILLYANNRLMLEHLLDHAAPFDGDDRMQFTATWPLWAPPDVRADVVAGCHEAGVRTVPPWIALFTRRDLIVLADYPSRRTKLWLACQAPRLYVGHYIHQGKSTTGEDHRHAEYASRVDGERFYTAVFESSDMNRAAVIARDPELEGVVRTVGYLRADRLLARNADRRQIRRDLGLSDSDMLVYVQSTWQTGSLMDSLGTEIVGEAERLAIESGWSFVFSTHPNHWRGPWALERPWGRFLRAHESSHLRVVSPDERPDDYIVASDVVVTDHGSQAVLVSLLDKPMVFYRSKERELAIGSPVWRLRDTLPNITTAQDLGPSVSSALHDFDSDAHRTTTADFLSFRGSAADRVRQEIYELLDLGPPELVRRP